MPLFLLHLYYLGLERGSSFLRAPSLVTLVGRSLSQFRYYLARPLLLLGLMGLATLVEQSLSQF